jgi:hypothetical protein
MTPANPKKPSASAGRAPSPRKGMRLHKIWLPDMESPEFIAQARRDSLAIARCAEEKDLQDWMDSVSILQFLPDYEAPGWPPESLPPEAPAKK